MMSVEHKTNVMGNDVKENKENSMKYKNLLDKLSPVASPASEHDKENIIDKTDINSVPLEAIKHVVEDVTKEMSGAAARFEETLHQQFEHDDEPSTPHMDPYTEEDLMHVFENVVPIVRKMSDSITEVVHDVVHRTFSNDHHDTTTPASKRVKEEKAEASAESKGGEHVIELEDNDEPYTTWQWEEAFQSEPQNAAESKPPLRQRKEGDTMKLKQVEKESMELQKAREKIGQRLAAESPNDCM